MPINTLTISLPLALKTVMLKTVMLKTVMLKTEAGYLKSSTTMPTCVSSFATTTARA